MSDYEMMKAALRSQIQRRIDKVNETGETAIIYVEGPTFIVRAILRDGFTGSCEIKTRSAPGFPRIVNNNKTMKG